MIYAHDIAASLMDAENIEHRRELGVSVWRASLHNCCLRHADVVDEAERAYALLACEAKGRTALAKHGNSQFLLRTSLKLKRGEVCHLVQQTQLHAPHRIVLIKTKGLVGRRS